MHTDKTTLSGQAAAPAVPKPGTEFAFHVSDIAYAAAGLLGEEWSGEDWSAEAHDFGQGSTIKGPYTTGFELHTDHDRDLVIGYTRFEGDGFPGRDERELPPDIGHCDTGVYLRDAESGDGLDGFASRVANASAT